MTNLPRSRVEGVWVEKPQLLHLPEGPARDQLENRRRLRAIRYMLFRLQNQEKQALPLEAVEGLLPGFVHFWLGEKPAYAISPRSKRVPVPPQKDKSVADLGGYKTFAVVWDVDSDLVVYLRHASVWQEWNAVMAKVVPIIGE